MLEKLKLKISGKEVATLIDIIKQIANQSSNSSKPLEIFEAVVITPPPELSIQLPIMKQPIPKQLLNVAEHLTRHTRIVTIEHGEMTSRDLGDGTDIDFLDTDDLVPPYTYYKHSNVEFTFKDVLKTGDRVLVLRNQGGQKYTILDRIVNY